MLVAVFALMLQQAAPGPVVWSEPPPAPPPVVAPTTHNLPDWARADPFGYERSECSPLIRAAGESQEACQARVRVELASDLGDALPAALRPTGSAAPEACRSEVAGDRYALQCGAPTRADRPIARLEEQSCETRPQAQPGGGVTWTQECRAANGDRREDDGLTFRLGGRD